MSVDPVAAGPVAASADDLPFLRGGGEMGERMRAFDWQGSLLGTPGQWPAALRTCLRILLTTNHPAFVFWGDRSVCFYNDAYSRSLGPEKHPSILGAAGRDAWPEIWPIIGPQIEQVMTGGGATWHENQLVPIYRHGQVEEVYWTYSYGPIDDDTAPHGVGGVLVLCTETTGQVLAGHRLQMAEARWRALFDQAPGFMCVLDGPEHRFEYANARYLELVDQRPIIGKTVREAVPEIEGQGFVALLDQVYRCGEVYNAWAAPVRLARGSDGARTLHYLDFIYQPIRNEAGEVTGIFVEGSDVTQRTVAELHLREADRRKDEFLATLSHELRNPLAPIRNAAAMLRQQPDAAKREWAAQVIERQVDTMARLLEGLLDVARATRGTLTLSKERTTLSAAVNAALEVVQPALEARRHRIAVALHAPSIELDADPLRLSQVLANLLGNAIKYTDPEGLIEVSSRLDDGMLALSVKDSGIGLTPESLHSVFRMFSQVQSALGRSEGGLGIGLALVKALVELHGGRVQGHSDGLDTGSTFTVWLPLSASSDAAASFQTAASFKAPEQVAPAEVKRIVIADDNQDAAETLGSLLELAGHVVKIATNGKAAVALAQEFRPDLVILDIGMPLLNGYDAARAIRAQEWGRHMTLVALTGWGRERDRRKSLEAGFDAHMTKPIEPMQLAELRSFRPLGRATDTGRG